MRPMMGESDGKRGGGKSVGESDIEGEMMER